MLSSAPSSNIEPRPKSIRIEKQNAERFSDLDPFAMKALTKYFEKYILKVEQCQEAKPRSEKSEQAYTHLPNPHQLFRLCHVISTFSALISSHQAAKSSFEM